MSIARNLTEPREMRKALIEMSYSGRDFDDDWSTPIPTLVHNARRMAEAAGLSVEDLMTVIAYHSLLGYEQAFKKMAELLAVMPAPPMIINRDTIAKGESE